MARLSVQLDSELILQAAKFKWEDIFCSSPYIFLSIRGIEFLDILLLLTISRHADSVGLLQLCNNFLTYALQN